ncbi:hypothetical protein [Oscillibacter sp.]|jgi:hypothetical protein|uniref:hypothetical protein n=1 Tax=Oscillibacter sp. TaxID=1945593 RepID=UPI00216C1F8A|nr:hypothetical protein [Oscillibacter sp.]MCI9240816.1 hypothetical protein [Oscillibacter sp.]
MNGTTQKKRPVRNQDVRAAIEGAGLRYWWVAEELGMACGTLSNHLRKELPPEEREAVLTAVQRLAERLGAPAPESPSPGLTLEARASFPGRGW